MRSLKRYFHTIRHLRPIQIVARIWFRFYRPRVDLRAAPAVRVAQVPYVPPIASAPSMTGPRSCRFLNEDRQCATAADWDPPGASPLWIYNLHYCDDLNARDAAARTAWHLELLARWVAENPPSHGPGWEPYPVSRRIVNWVKWSLRGNDLPPACVASLAVQSRWLMRRLEYHILGNHLFANAKALLHAGLYFCGDEAEHWYRRGYSIIERQLREQVLCDGGHFELSTLYHSVVLDDLLDLVNLMRTFGRTIPGEWLRAITRMRNWLAVLVHPDGEIAFFNDAAFAVAPTHAELEAYAARLDLPLTEQAHDKSLAVLEPSGYARMTGGRAYLICDVGPVGPDHLPGHAHADTLSFELSLDRQRVIVNSGTSQYGVGIERQRQRGTAAHSTVVVDGQDSSEVWGGFRVARRARAIIGIATFSAEQGTIEAGHDGYRRLRGKVTHTRRWSLRPHALCIEDRIDGVASTIESYLHLHPAVVARRSGPFEIHLSWGDHCSARLSFEGAASLELNVGKWHPQFGIATPNHCIIARPSGPTLITQIEWADDVRLNETTGIERAH